jgi:hypothetical protein
MDSTESSLGHVTQNLCFASGWICGSRSALQCVWGTNHQHTIFLARVRLVRIPENVHRDVLRQTCVFASSGICVSGSALRCIRGVKHRHNIFRARVGLVQFP